MKNNHAFILGSRSLRSTAYVRAKTAEIYCKAIQFSRKTNRGLERGIFKFIITKIICSDVN